MVQDGPKWIQDDPSRVQHAPTRHQKKGPSGLKRSPRESQDILSSSKMAPRWQPDNPRLSQGVFSVGPCRRKAPTTALSERFQETILLRQKSLCKAMLLTQTQTKHGPNMIPIDNPVVSCCAQKISHITTPRVAKKGPK